MKPRVSPRPHFPTAAKMVEEEPGLIPSEERRRLLALARRSIRAYVLEQALPEGSPPQHTGPRRGAFVTLHREGRLRGCIGRPESTEPLGSVVAACAVLAASRDPRFPPVRADEIHTLEIEISILAVPEEVPAADVLERIQPGVHGAAITLGGSRGLLLPQVAAEYGWGARRFLEETCRKAGLPTQAWQDPEARIELFTAEVFSESQYPGNLEEAAS
jgi:AmmeMemoRadiSam system protein A